MSNDRTIRKRVFLRLLGSPVVLAPAVLGATGATVLWAMNWQTSLGLFAGLAGLLGSLGAYLTRALLDDGRTARAVLLEAEREQQAARQAILDELDRRLVRADQDPRPETALRDLRALVRAFDDLATTVRPDHLPAVLSVRTSVQQLFDQSVQSLEQTMRLHDTARQLQLADARRPLLEQRERLIADLQVTLRQLGATLAALQQLGAGEEGRTELARLREELDQSLQVADRVEARLNDLLQDAPSLTREQPLRPEAGPNVKGD